jgi:hypothetical protein
MLLLGWGRWNFRDNPNLNLATFTFVVGRLLPMPGFERLITL